MRLRAISAALLGIAQFSAFGQQPSHVGQWVGTMQGNGGREIRLEVNLKETEGTWKMIAAGAGGRNNPCFNKELPASVTPGAQRVEIDVHGGQIIQGCMNQKATLTLNDNQLAGTLADGRQVSLSRQ